jgi:Predicted permease
MLVLAALLVLAISFLFYIRPVFIALILGLLITVLLDKTVDVFLKLTKNYSAKKRYAIAIVGFAVVFAAVGIIAVNGTVSLMNNVNAALDAWDDFNYDESVGDLAEDLSTINISESIHLIGGEEENIAAEGIIPPIIETKNSTSAEIPQIKMTRVEIMQSVLQSGGGLLLTTTETISMAFSIMFASALIIPIMVGYYFKEKGHVGEKLTVFAPNRYKAALNTAIKEITNDMNTYVAMKVLESVIITFLYCVGLYAIGVPHWLFISIIMGVFNIVPYIGFIVPSIVMIVYAYTIGPEVLIAVIGVIIVIQLFDYFFILPGMVMKTVRIRSFTAIILTLAGLKLFGIFGLIFAVPIFIFCKIIMVAAYKMLVEMYPDSSDANEAIADES